MNSNVSLFPCLLHDFSPGTCSFILSQQVATKCIFKAPFYKILVLNQGPSAEKLQTFLEVNLPLPVLTSSVPCSLFIVQVPQFKVPVAPFTINNIKHTISNSTGKSLWCEVRFVCRFQSKLLKFTVIITMKKWGYFHLHLNVYSGWTTTFLIYISSLFFTHFKLLHTA